MKITSFNQWLDTFVQEKGFDVNHDFEVSTAGARRGALIHGLIHLNGVMDFIKKLDGDEGRKIQLKIKEQLVAIDFANGDCMHFFGFMAQGIADSCGVEGFAAHPPARKRKGA